MSGDRTGPCSLETDCGSAGVRRGATRRVSQLWAHRVAGVLGGVIGGMVVATGVVLSPFLWVLLDTLGPSTSPFAAAMDVSSSFQQSLV